MEMIQQTVFALDPRTIDQIAAGEVIEGPHSVVKEMVENALDAGATRIVVEISLGGKSLIKVSDNGQGILPQDLPLVCKPHTTSKIKTLADLDSIHSYGFRGEALASMVAVGDVTIETRHKTQNTGLRWKERAGISSGMEVCSREVGTSIYLEHLFLHTPVRRKFLGTERSETQKIVRTLERIALNRPQIAFTCLQQGKILFNLPVESPIERLKKILGKLMEDEWIPCEYVSEQISIQGYLSPPEKALRRNFSQYFYLNGKYFQSPVLVKALVKAYEGLKPGHYPPAILFFEINPSWIDINVHPSKKEVRFLDESLIFQAVQRAVYHSLNKVVVVPQGSISYTSDSSNNTLINPSSDPGYQAFQWNPETPKRIEDFSEQLNLLDPKTNPREVSSNQEAKEIRIEEGKNPDHFKKHLSKGSPENISSGSSDTWAQVFEFPSIKSEPSLNSAVQNSEKMPGEVSMYQIHQRFIVVEVQSGFLVINQKAAHQRVLYEKSLMALQKSKALSSQQLLFPELFECSPAESLFLEENSVLFQKMGFEIVPFGPSSFQIRGIPEDCPVGEGAKQLGDLLHEITQNGSTSQGVYVKMALAYANHFSIPAKMALSFAERESLVNRLFATQNPAISPFGLPVFLRFTLEELFRKLKLTEGE